MQTLQACMKALTLTEEDDFQEVNYSVGKRTDTTREINMSLHVKCLEQSLTHEKTQKALLLLIIVS